MLLDGYPIQSTLSETVLNFTSTLVSDASGTGHYMFELAQSNNILLRRLFTAFEAKESSTFREFTCFAEFYLSDAVLPFRGTNLLHLTDSKNVETMFAVGSRNPKFQPIVMQIVLRMKALDIKLRVEWRSREDPLLQMADLGSKEFDVNDFSLDFETISYIMQKIGPFDIDCFASSFNKKCVHFYSKFEDANTQGCLGRNFFSQEIPSTANLWVMPPPSKVVPAILHLFRNRARGVLIVPAWKSCIFWNALFNDGFHANYWIVEILKLDPVYYAGPDVVSDQFKGRKDFVTLALSFNFQQVTHDTLWLSRVDKNYCYNDGCLKCAL